MIALSLYPFRSQGPTIYYIKKSALISHLKYLPHHALGLARVHPSEQDVVVQDVVHVVDHLPLFVALW